MEETWDSCDGLLADISARSESFAAAQQIAPDIIERFRSIGIYRALVANEFGGDERTPGEFCRKIEAISEADGSSGWVASFGVASIYLAALPRETLCKIYGAGPDVIFAAGIYPIQAVQKNEDVYSISGHWKFASGCTGADLLGAGIKIGSGEAGGLPRVAVMPAADAEIVPNWNVIGMRGTGSHDVVCSGVAVSEDWTFERGGKPSIDAALYRYPTVAFAAQVLAAVGLGVARSAMNDVIEFAGRRRSITGAPAPGDRAYVQSEIGKAEARLRSARAYFYQATDDVWQTVHSGAIASREDVTMIRLASTHLAETSADVARIACELAGTMAIYDSHRLSRAMRDAHVVKTHALLNIGTYPSAGAVLLGLPAPAEYP